MFDVIFPQEWLPQITELLNVMPGFTILILMLHLICTGIFLYRFKKTKRLWTYPLRTLAVVLTGTLALSLLLVNLSLHSYQLANQGRQIATLKIKQTGYKRFFAELNFPDQSTQSYRLAGDTLYIDAYIIKWQPILTFLGLPTYYQLDRISGRFLDLSEEKKIDRTIHAIAPQNSFNLFHLVQKFTLLKLFVDATYGSATFMPIKHLDEYDLFVTSSGLMLRVETQ